MVLCLLVVFGVDLKVALGMGAGGADLRCLGAGDQVTAVAALPDFNAALLENLGGFHTLKERMNDVQSA